MGNARKYWFWGGSAAMVLGLATFTYETRNFIEMNKTIETIPVRALRKNFDREVTEKRNAFYEVKDEILLSLVMKTPLKDEYFRKVEDYAKARTALADFDREHADELKAAENRLSDIVKEYHGDQFSFRFGVGAAAATLGLLSALIAGPPRKAKKLLPIVHGGGAGPA